MPNRKKRNISDEERSQQTARDGRTELKYQRDTSAYDDDFRAPEPKHARATNRQKASNRSGGAAHASPENAHAGNKRYEAANRQTGRDSNNDISPVRYQHKEENKDTGKLTRASRWTEDSSFYEYRDILRTSNARKSAEEDMKHEDDNYFDVRRRASNNDRGRQA